MAVKAPDRRSNMPFTCNIDSRGKFARLVYGIILVAIGVVLLVFWALREGGFVSWIVCVACLLSGAFAIFEARAGWCVMRAMGFKTPV